MHNPGKKWSGKKIKEGHVYVVDSGRRQKRKYGVLGRRGRSISYH